MALANGCSKIKCGPLTLHTQTAIKVTEIMTGVSHSRILLVREILMKYKYCCF